jgi:hypothetical protein
MLAMKLREIENRLRYNRRLFVLSSSPNITMAGTAMKSPGTQKERMNNIINGGASWSPECPLAFASLKPAVSHSNQQQIYSKNKTAPRLSLGSIGGASKTRYASKAERKTAGIINAIP